MSYVHASCFVAFHVFARGASSSSSPSTFWNETVVKSRRLSPPSVEAGLLDVHIPKTGGTSLLRLWAILVQSRGLCASEVYQTHVPKRNITKCDDAARMRLLSGHASLNLREASLALPVHTVLTLLVLRDPLPRIVSFANFHNVRLEQFEG